MLVIACRILITFYKRLGKDYNKYEEIKNTQTKILNDFAWNEDRYIRAVSDEGLLIGNRNEPCGSLWINSQSWAVLSGTANEERGNKAFDTVMNTLDCGFGLLKLYPPLQRNYPSKENELTFAQPGVAENGGVFSHANTWAIIALCMLGRNEDAFKVYKELIPDSVATKLGVERYCAEPYVYSSNIRSPRANDGGKAGVSWLTGTASWMMIALTEYIYGVRPTLDGLEISPCITNEWDKVKVKRCFRGCTYNIEIDNSLKCGNRVKKIYVDGKEIEGNVVLSTNKTANVLVVMG
jgi:cellobiose phosphorylase